MRATILGVCLLGAAIASPAAAPYSNIAAVILPAVALDPEYAARPAGGAYYLTFAGEPLDLVIQLTNTSETPETLVTRAAEPGGDLFVRVTRDGEPADIAIAVLPQLRERGPGLNLQVFWSERISLLPRRTVELSATIAGLLPPGQYEFQLETTLTDARGQPLRPQGVRLPIEVRASTQEVQTEVLRRRALFSYVKRDFADVERQLAELELQAPNNFSVFVIRANVAVAQGRAAEAAAHYDRAIAILEAGADKEYLRWNNADRVRETLAALHSSRARTSRQ